MRITTIKSAAVGAAVGIGFIAVGSARADDNPSTICVATTVEGEPVVAAAGPEAAPTSAPTAPTTAAAAAAPTTAAAPASPTTAAAPAPPTTAAATAAAPTTAAAEPATGTAAGLPPGATVQQISAALVPVLGPTTDLAAELAPLGAIGPSGIPTPDGATIERLSVYYYPNEDGSRSYYDATLLFTTSVPAADMVTQYQTQMVAAGYVQTGDSVENDDNRQERYLTYATPNSTYSSAEVEIAIVDGDSDFAQINIRDSLDPATMQMFSAWPTGMPLIDQATEISDASVRLDSFGSDVSASIRTSYNLPIPAADAQAQFLAALPSTPYTIDPDYESDENTTYLVGGEFESLTVSTNEGYPEGTTYFSVSADVDIQL